MRSTEGQGVTEETWAEEEERKEGGNKGKKDKHSGLASHISVQGLYKHPAQLGITEHCPNKI